MRDTSDAMIVNDAAAQHLWPGETAIGNQVCVNCTPENPGNWKRVIGVVSSVRHSDLDAPPGFNVYMSSGALSQAAFLIVRTERPEGEMARAIRQAIASVDPEQPVLLTASMRSLLWDSIADRRFIVTLLGATGTLALLMALAGIYGVTAYTTSRRTQEIGVRMAVGASPGRIHALFFRQAFRIVLIGLAIGFASALFGMRTLQSLIPGLRVERVDTIWASGCLILITSALACWLPANRATKGDPISALRQD
jgi:putative ABC transport system permease protein